MPGNKGIVTGGRPRGVLKQGKLHLTYHRKETIMQRQVDSAQKKLCPKP